MILLYLRQSSSPLQEALMPNMPAPVRNGELAERASLERRQHSVYIRPCTVQVDPLDAQVGEVRKVQHC